MRFIWDLFRVYAMVNFLAIALYTFNYIETIDDWLFPASACLIFVESISRSNLG